MKIRFTAEIELNDDLWGFDEEVERYWFFNKVMKSELILVENGEVDDELGPVKIIGEVKEVKG